MLEGLHLAAPPRPTPTLIVDNFAGGGGASTGIEAATGRPVDVAINHDAEAIAMHAANHPLTRHFVKSIYAVDPIEATCGQAVLGAWFSPDCKHFSKAKGGKPVEKNIRDLAMVVPHWIKRLGPDRQPRIIWLENVEEFRTWGPLTADGMPCKARKGETFEAWVKQLRRAGYKVEWRELRACDYGAPTSRKRLFIIARCDGEKIVWPTPSHGKPDSSEVLSGQRLPWRTAAEIIDWSIPCPSIFERKKELKDATKRRIAAGIMRYVINNPRPFIVPITHSGGDRVHSADDPLRTVTTAARGEMALVSPVIVGCGGRRGQSGPVGPEEPYPTATAKADACLVAVALDRQFGKSRGADAAQPMPATTAGGSGKTAAIAATLIQVGYGERDGQAPRVPHVDKPLGTAVAGGIKHAAVAAFLHKYKPDNPGQSLDEPAPTITANSFIKRPGGAPPLAVITAHIAQHNSDRTPKAGRSAEMPISTITSSGSHQAVVASSLVKLRGTSKDGQKVDEPLHTVSAGGTHFAEVSAFLVKYYGAHQHGQAADQPLDSVTSKARFGLVTVTIDGEEYFIADIGMRMLTPRELARAQGFPDSYILDPIGPNGKPLTKTAQIRMIGNSVCPQMAEALVRANLILPGTGRGTAEGGGGAGETSEKVAA